MLQAMKVFKLKKKSFNTKALTRNFVFQKKQNTYLNNVKNKSYFKTKFLQNYIFLYYPKTNASSLLLITS